MSMKEFNSDEQIRRIIGEIPDEKPSQSDWDNMKTRLMAEGLIGRSRRNVFFYFSAGIALLALLGTIFMVNHLPDSSLTKTTDTVTPDRHSSAVTQNAPVQNAVEKSSSNIVQVNNPTSTSLVTSITKENASSVKINTAKSYSPELEAEVSSTIPSTHHTTGSNRTMTSSVSEKSPMQVGEDESVQNLAPLTYGQDAVTAEDSPGVIYTAPADEWKETNSTTELNGYTPPRRISSRKWFSGVYFSYDMNSFGFTSSNPVGNEMINTGFPSKDNFQFTAGVITGYNFTSKFSVTAGVLYSQKKKFDYSYLKLAANSSDFDHYAYQFSGRYIEIPVKGNFYVYQTHHHPNMNWGVYAAIGLMTTFNLPQRDNDYFQYNSLDETGQYQSEISLKWRSVGETGIFAVGYQLKFSNYWNVYIEPGYEYHFTSVLKNMMNKEIPVQQYIRTPRVACGLNYNF